MSSRPTPDAAPDPENRLIGRFSGTPGGSVLLCVGGLHGNEPAGVHALRRVLATLSETRPDFQGRIVGLMGNLTALSRRVRFVQEDLNRVWTLDRVARLRKDSGNGSSAPPDGQDPGARGATVGSHRGSLRSDSDPSDNGGVPSTIEAREQDGLLGALEAEFAEARDSRVYFMDLHTTSSESVPFLTFSDSLPNRSFAGHFPIPLVLGVEEVVEGTLLDYVDHREHVAIGVEGGNHEDPESVDHLEAVLWLALVSLGMVELDDVPEADGLRRRLSRAVRRVPTVFEVRYRHGLRPGDEFRMKPGFSNFQPVREGELLAVDRRGEVRAPMSGRVFLPLYQRKGDEGFFIVREVAPFWLKVSEWMRRLNVERLVRMLPGVRPHPDREETVRVSPLIASRLTINVFHLLGYRRERSEAGELLMSRRKDAVEGTER